MYEIFEQLLKEKNLTAYKVHKATGVAQSSLSDWKNGKSKPKYESMKKIADFLGVSVDYLTEGNAAPPPTAQQKKPIPQEDALSLDTLEYALYGEARDLDDDEKQQVLDLVRLMKRKKQAMQNRPE